MKSESPISNSIEQVIQEGGEEPTLFGIPMSDFDLSSMGIGEDSNKGFLGKLGDGLKNLGSGVKEGVSNLKEKPMYQNIKDGIQKTAQEYKKLQNGEKQDLSLTLPTQERIPSELDGYGIAPKHSVEMGENIPNVSMDFPDKHTREEVKPTTLRDDPMWEELAYNLQHQPSAEEVAQQEVKLQAEIDAKLDKIYGVESRVMQGAPRGSSTGAVVRG